MERSLKALDLKIHACCIYVKYPETYFRYYENFHEDVLSCILLWIGSIKSLKGMNVIDLVVEVDGCVYYLN